MKGVFIFVHSTYYITNKATLRVAFNKLAHEDDVIPLRKIHYGGIDNFR